MVHDYHHCLTINCLNNTTSPEDKQLNPGTYFLCNKNSSQIVEETFCSVDQDPKNWFNDLKLETFLYDCNNTSEEYGERVVNNHWPSASCLTDSNCCFSNHTIRLLKETACPQNYNCSTSTYITFTKEEEDFGKMTGILFIPLFLAMGLAAIFGNLAVVIHSVKVIFKKGISGRPETERQLYHVLILNLSFADLAMGFYVVGSVSGSIKYLLRHAHGDETTKTTGTTLCLVLGLINFVASQISVTAIATISGLRLHSVIFPYKAVRLKVILWIVLLTWLFWLTAASLPATDNDVLNTVFNHDIRIDFENKKFVKLQYSHLYFLVEKFLDNINTRCGLPPTKQYKFTLRPTWKLLLNLTKKLKLVDPNVEKRITYLGYYNGQFACTMKFFLSHKNPASNFTLSIVLYNMISFIFILSSQIVITWKTSTCHDLGSHLLSCCRCFGPKKEQKVLSQQQKREAENRKMHRRMLFIVLTDFCCWIPVCVFSIDFYVRSMYAPPCTFLSYTRSLEYWFPAFLTLLLPINSAINPFIYSFRLWTPLRKALGSKCGKKSADINFQPAFSQSVDSVDTISSRMTTSSRPTAL